MVTRADIAGDALKYRGHPYVWGAWDCSGMVNHVLGQDLGFTLPGGIRHYKGPPPHGPVVADYWNWGGATTIPGPPQAGDLVMWLGISPAGHIGIAVSGTHMVSALDPQLGTLVTPIAGYGPPGTQGPRYRRVHGAGGGRVGPGVGRGLHGHIAATGQQMLIRLMLITGLSAGALLVVGAGLLALEAAGPALLSSVLLPKRRVRADI